MASGLGKTMTSIFDIKQFFEDNSDNERVLILCHSEAILNQTKDVFKRNFGDIYSYGMYNHAQKTRRRTDFLFANLQSVNLHLDDFDPCEFDYILVDEAHHAPAETYRKAIEYFRPQFLLGMTATPDRVDDADLSEIFGETVFEYRLVDAIRDRWLSRVKYRIKTDELQNLKFILDSGNRYTLSQLNREIFLPKRDEEIVRIIKDEIKNREDPTTVIFCQSIAHAEHIAKLMGNVAVIHSGMTTTERNISLKGYREGTIKTICAVDILNEGIDVPRTDVIVFLRVTQSKIIFSQQLGRGLRRAKNKDEVLVLDFVSSIDRLSMLFQLKREFKSSIGRYSYHRSRCTGELLSIEMDTPEFQEREEDIIALIEYAEGRTIHRQSFPNWENCSKDAIWSDIVQRFVDFRETNGRIVGKLDLGKDGIPSMYFIKSFLGPEVALTDVQQKAYPDIKCKAWTKDGIEAALDRIAIKLGKVPNQIELRCYAKSHKNAVPSVESLNRVGYKNYREVYQKLGYEIDSSYMPWTDEEIATFMRQAYEQYGRIPTMAEYRNFQLNYGSRCLARTQSAKLAENDIVGQKLSALELASRKMGLLLNKQPKFSRRSTRQLATIFFRMRILKSIKRPTPSRIFLAIQSSRMRLALELGVKPSKTPGLKLCRIIAADQRGKYKQQSPETRGFLQLQSIMLKIKIQLTKTLESYQNHKLKP